MACLGHAQGFVNLDFEQGYSVSNTIPHWTAYDNGVPITVLFDATSLSGASVSLFDTNGPYYLPPIQGKYFAWLIGGYEPSYGPVALGQTGQVPVWAESISFSGSDVGMQITFNGQLLNFLVTGSTANFNTYAADISAFAGQTGQLLFTVPPYNNGGMLDNIQFSSSPVPEPGELALVVFSALLFGCRRWRSL